MKCARMIAAIAVASVGLIAPVPAQAAPQAPVTGWQNGAITCPNGAVSVFPVIVTNTTSAPRTGSYTVPFAISTAVQVASSPGGINCDGSSNYKGFGANFTVAPGQTSVLWVGLGMSTSSNTGFGSHNIGFGGLPSGSSGQAWYDLGLTLNNATTLVSGGNTFNNLTVTYQNTGGLDANTNGQNLFNIVACDSTSPGVYPTAQLLTPYNNGQWTQGPTYYANQAMCAGWMPEGVQAPFTNTGNLSGVNITGAQAWVPSTNSSTSYLGVAGTSTVPVTSVTVTWSGGGSGTQYLTQGASPLPWFGQDPVTGDWVVSNLFPPTTSSGNAIATVSVNGVVVGTATLQTA